MCDSVWMSECERERVCVCVCMCMLCVCVCVCVCAYVHPVDVIARVYLVEHMQVVQQIDSEQREQQN